MSEVFNHTHRSATGCLCCADKNLQTEVQLLSGTIAERGWGGAPETTFLVSCKACGFRFFERGLDDDEVAR